LSSVASLRQVRRRIRSVENTKKITRAMEMVAAAKLRRFQDFLESARPYTERIEELLDRFLAELPEGYTHPFLERPAPEEGVKRAVVFVIFTSDTGLCGTYNADLENLAKSWLAQNSGRRVELVFIGKHGAGIFRGMREKVLGTFSDLRVSRVEEILWGLRETLGRAAVNSDVDEILAVYTRMETLSRYRPALERMLPFSRKSSQKESAVGYLVEPDRRTVLDKLIPEVFEARLRFAFYHALLTEQIARMTAMRQATQNAEEMIDELTLLRNKARQAAITKEIIEVVSGSQAQKLK